MTARYDAEPSRGQRARAPEGDGISIALVEDNRVLREGLTELLNRVRDFRVVYTGSGLDLNALQRLKAHVVLLDIGLENGDSLSLAQRIVQEFPESRVLIMDLLPSHEDIREFVAAGVAGFVLKDASVDEFMNAIRAVAGGAHVLPGRITGALFSQIASETVSRRDPNEPNDVGLTPREKEVIDLISEGLSNKKIAVRLDISTHTVKSHVRNIMEKLALHTRLQLAAWAHHGED
jgi:two-component system nitrate/nitrite response regulator NarL